MKSVLHVINRCLVIEFYKQNAAFFGLILLVLFGFIKSSEHIAIGSFLVSNPSALLYLYVLWLAYALKVMLFVLPAINKKENYFLEVFLLLPPHLKITGVLIASVSLLLPLVVYASFLIILAIPSWFFFSILSLLLCLVLFIIFMTCVIYVRLNNLPHEKSIKQIRLLSTHTKPPFLFFIEYVFRNEMVLFLLSKFYVCSLIIGTSLLYKTDHFDLRLLTTGILLSFVGNVALIHKFVWFQHHQMIFSKNLPQSNFQLLTQPLAMLALLLSPEIIVLLRHYPLDPTIIDITGIILFGVSLVFLLYGLLLVRQVELSSFMTVIFWLVVLITFMILFSIHPLVLGVCFFIISISIVSFRYYRYEYIDD